jgi:GT2 family glycosyltransferase
MRASASETRTGTTCTEPAAERLAIVICTKDRPAELARAIESIRRSSPLGRSADILVVEEAAEPRAVEGTRYVWIPTRGLGFGYARNVAVAHVHAPLVVFIDDDCVADTGWLEALIEPLEQDETVLGVAGAVLVRDCGPIGYAENILGFPGGGLRYLDRAAGKIVATGHLSTCNCAYRRTAILRAGGFSEQARHGGEDTLLADQIIRLGPCRYVPGARVYHRTRDSLPAVFRWFMRRGESEIAMLAAQDHRAAHVMYFVRSSWTVRLLILVGILAQWPALLSALPLLVAGYYGAILWRFRFARRYVTHCQGWWWVPVVKGVMDLGTEIGRWKTLVRSTGP